MTPTLRSLVTERGLRLDWLAAQLGVTDRTINRWLRGEARLPITRVKPLAAVFGVSVDIVVSAALNTRNNGQTS